MIGVKKQFVTTISHQAMRRVAAILLIVLSCISASAQQKVDPQACSMTPLYQPPPSMEACKNRSLKGLKSPMVNYVIKEDGLISTVKLVKSSGLPCWDRAILATVKTWKYPKAPGCGERKATLSIDIDVSKLPKK